MANHIDTCFSELERRLKSVKNISIDLNSSNILQKTMGDTFLNESVITRENVGELLNAEKQELIVSCLGQVGLEQVERPDSFLTSRDQTVFCVFGTRPVTNKETTVCT